MSMQPLSNGSFTGLARRWLKTQLQFHGNPQRAYQDRQEAESLEAEMRERAEEAFGRAVVSAMLPPSWKRGLAEMEDRKIAGEARRKRDRLEAQLTLPRAKVDFTFRGAHQGSVNAELPARIEWPEHDGVFAVIELEAIEPLRVGDRAFHGLRLALPAEDLAAGRAINLAKAVDHHWRYWDPLDAQVWLGSIEDAFYWSADYGSAHIWPEADLRGMRLIMPIENANGERISIEGTIRLEEQISA